MDWGTMGGFMWVGMLIWAILGIALIVLTVLGAVWLARRLGRDERGPRPPNDRSALEELELRYARGEGRPRSLPQDPRGPRARRRLTRAFIGACQPGGSTVIGPFRSRYA